MAEPAVPSQALKDAGRRLMDLLVQQASQAAIDRVSGLSDRLADYSENGGANRNDTGERGDGRPSMRASLSSGVTSLKDKVKNVLGGGGGSDGDNAEADDGADQRGGGRGGGKKLKVTNIVEQTDVGLPLRTTYDLWTRWEHFPGFMKKVEEVSRKADETTSWKAQVLWSHRIWEATVVEQVPDSHIVWRSKGAKGHVDGAVSFTALGPNLTRVLVVLEYWPQGLFERTGNLWRAQGRRARLELKHFRRHAMTSVLREPDNVEGWRGEIRDSQVIRTHEQALCEEQAAEQEQAPGEQEQAPGEQEQAPGEQEQAPGEEPEHGEPPQAEQPEHDGHAESGQAKQPAEHEEPEHERAGHQQPEDEGEHDEEPDDQRVQRAQHREAEDGEPAGSRRATGRSTGAGARRAR
jgi:uncharacterized membrane protein